MTQRTRPAVHVDITKGGSVEAANGAKITTTTWNPNQGADLAKQRAEQIAREMHQQEMDRYNSDPTVQRIINLEKKFDALTELVGKLTARIGNV